MIIPKHDEIRVPALKLLQQKGTLKSREFEAPLAEHFGLSEDEVSQEYASRNGRIFYDRVSWALSYMFMAGLVERPKRGVYEISDVGLKLLETPGEINDYIAKQVAKREKTQKSKVQEASPADTDLTPEEELYSSYERIRDAIYDELLSVIISKTPREFEKLVVDLLQRMGYGGEVKAASEVTSYSNDRGIDGVIKEDVLGLGRIHIQAKRYARNNNIGREEIQKFVGALAVAQSNKGVFITTSGYTKGALEYTDSLNHSTTLVLIDGVQLAEYIYNYGLGMQVEQTFEIKKLDSDYWDSMEDSST